MFLARERATLNRYLPGLETALVGTPLSELERQGGVGIELFRNAGGPALMIPEEIDGCGASALDALRIQRAIGASSPSLAVATTMHHFAVSCLVHVADSRGTGWALLKDIATKRKLLASGFAEGRPDGRILAPAMTAKSVEGGVRVTGIKRPCSMARSMDVLAASVLLPRRGGPGDQLAIVLIPANEPGVAVTPFWSSFALAGAQSDQVAIDDVLVPDEFVVPAEVTEAGRLDDIQTGALIWLELLMIGSYLGAASALVERAATLDRVSEARRLDLITGLESAMSAAENIARQVPDDPRDVGLLVDTLLVRYAAQDAIAGVVPKAVEILGGLTFMTADDVGYLAAVVHGLGFHPLSRSKMTAPLMRYFAGGPLEIT